MLQAASPNLVAPFPCTLQPAILDFIVATGSAFSIVANPSFRNLLQVAGELTKAGERLRCPSRGLLSTSLLDNAHQEVIRRNIEILSQCDYVSITTDGTTSQNGESYWVVTAHGVTRPDFDFVSVTLGLTPVRKSHTASNLASEITPILRQHDIGTKIQLLAVVTDEGGAAPAIAAYLDALPHRCAAHRLQTVLRNAFDNLVTSFNIVAVVIAALKAVVAKSHQSQSFRLLLTSEQLEHGIVPRKLVSAVPTRWNTILYSIESLLHSEEAMKSAIFKSCNETSRDSHFTFLRAANDEVWNILRCLKSILKPFEMTTTELSNDSTCTLDVLVMLVHLLLNDLKTADNSSMDAEEALSDQIGSRFRALLSDELRRKFPVTDLEAAACFLNPMLRGFSTQCMRDQITEKAENFMVSFAWPKEFSPAPPPTSSTATASSAPPHPSPATYREILSNSISSDIFTSPLSSWQDEIGIYYKTPPLPHEATLAYWWRHALLMPRLAYLARAVFSVTASQTSSERAFSNLKFNLPNSRASLDPLKASKLTVVRASIGKRNEQHIANHQKPRSEASIAADSSRLLSAQSTRIARIQGTVQHLQENQPLDPHNSGFGTSTSAISIDSADSSYSDDTSDDDLIALNGAEQDDDYDSDDEYNPPVDDEDAEIEPPEAKRRKTFETTDVIVKLSTHKSISNVMVGFFEGVKAGEKPPSFEKVFGNYYKCFEDYSYCTGDVTGSSFTFRLSAHGKIKFPTGRRNALAEMGYIRCVPQD